VRATAYAKLNLTLRVLGRRPDGFHDLEALTVSVADPHDVVEVRAVPHPGGITLEVAGETDDVPAGPENIAVRAGEALLVGAGRSGHGVKLTLRKKIPAGAGLGGGSADAAATLVAIQRLLEVEVDEAGLLEIGASVGSDVPFCLTGGAAWMRGRGEVLEPVAVSGGSPVVVALPPFRLVTRTVYEAWDELGGPRSTREVPAPAAAAGIVESCVNDLEPAAEHVEPRLVQFRQALEDAAGVPALLAGSGSAYVVMIESADRVASVVRKIRRALKVPVASSQTVTRGVRLGSG
jgi:4-diphosphocytidyl-2-C-methyl-D-erythritol kinase